jgi:hypothetical protein
MLRRRGAIGSDATSLRALQVGEVALADPGRRVLKGSKAADQVAADLVEQRAYQEEHESERKSDDRGCRKAPVALNEVRRQRAAADDRDDPDYDRDKDADLQASTDVHGKRLYPHGGWGRKHRFPWTPTAERV